MPRLLVDEALCTRCGLCSQACPVNIIRLVDGDVPRYVDDGAERCIICGHCEAVCPAGAVTVEDPRLDPQVCPSPETVLSPEQLGSHLRMRRSIRRYRQEPVDRGVIEQMLDIVRYAPTGANSQAVSWLVIHDTVELRRLTGLVVDWMRAMAECDTPLHSYFNFAAMVKAWEKGHDPICRSAPHLLIAHARENAPTARVDAVIALSHLEIVAPAFGVGVCWAGFFQFATESWEPLLKALSLPEGQVPVYAMMLGYPSFSYQRPPKRNPVSATWR